MFNTFPSNFRAHSAETIQGYIPSFWEEQIEVLYSVRQEPFDALAELPIWRQAYENLVMVWESVERYVHVTL